jgi:hypothetical protein
VTVSSIATAIVVGFVVGGAVRLAGDRSTPAWVLLTAGVAAALAGAAAARLIGIDTSRLGPPEVLIQIAAAGLAVAGAVVLPRCTDAAWRSDDREEAT